MAVALRSVSSASQVSGATSFNVAKPTGTAEGDILLMCSSADLGVLSDIGTPTGGATWALLDSRTGGTDTLHTKIFWKVAGASEPSTYSCSKNTSADSVVAVAAISGAATSTPVFAQLGTGTGGNVNTPGVTPDGTADLELRWAAGAVDEVPITWTSPATYTEQVDIQSADDYTTGSLATKILSSGSATSTETFVASQTLDFRMGFTVAVTSSSESAEITPAAADLNVEFTASALSAGSTVSAAPADLDPDFPAAGLSAGSTFGAVELEPTLQFPTPNVTTGDATIIDAATVTVGPDFPTPDISTATTVFLGSHDFGPDFPTPTITFEINTEITPATVTITPGIGADTTVPVLPGDQITGDYQLEYQGILVGGHGNVYQILAGTLEGWDDLPAIDSGNVTRPTRHGSWSGRDLAQDRQISVTIGVSQTGDFMAALSALRHALVPPEDGSEPVLVISGEDEIMFVGAKVDSRVATTRDYYQGWTAVSVRWTASDPRKRSLERHGVTIPLDSATLLANAGNIASHPLIRIHGPVTDPVITNSTLGRTLQFDLVLGSGERLEIDTDTGTVQLGDENKMSTLTGSSVPVQELVLAAGSNSLLYEAASDGENGVDVLWYDTIL